MNNPTFSFYSNIFGLVVGSVSLLGFVVSLCRPHLPSNKIKILETLLHETENIFNGAVEDGLLMHEFVQTAENRLALLREEAYSLRSRAYSATNLRRDYAEFLIGTSTAIGRTCQSLKKLRAEVITSSEENRHRLTQMNLVVQIPPPALFPHAESGQPATTSPPTEIARPCSCPPTWRPCDVQNVPIESNPFSDFSPSGSDVREADVHVPTSNNHVYQPNSIRNLSIEVSTV